MLSKQEKEKGQEAMVLIMDDIIPEDHLLKQIDMYAKRNHREDFWYSKRKSWV